MVEEGGGGHAFISAAHLGTQLSKKEKKERKKKRSQRRRGGNAALRGTVYLCRFHSR